MAQPELHRVSQQHTNVAINGDTEEKKCPSFFHCQEQKLYWHIRAKLFGLGRSEAKAGYIFWWIYL